MFCYIPYTNIIIILSFVILIATTLFCIKKRKFNIAHGCIIFICIFGIYLFAPLRFYFFKTVFKHPEYAEKIIKFSINPNEKRMCYKYLAQIYKTNTNKDFKNIDKAIYYMEKAIDGKYLENRNDTIILAHWYSLKGDWNNTIRLNDFINNTKGASLRNAYIMNDEYQKAINAYTPKENSLEVFLIADLYKNINNHKEANLSLKKAQKAYNSQLNKLTTKSEQIQYIESAKKYKTVYSYKQWLIKKCSEINFS